MYQATDKSVESKRVISKMDQRVIAYTTGVIPTALRIDSRGGFPNEI